MRFTVLLLLLLAFAAARSLIATRLDGFTIDEPYHIVSGVSYVTRGDYRLNPEQPPLVKLWAGAVTSRSLALPPFRKMDGKLDERDFHETAMFLRNDPDAVQREARGAMIAFHLLALAALAFAVRRLLGDLVSLGALAFLVIDPTVAAHMPVVMTDLPVALLSAIALFAAVAAFRSWRATDAALAALALGLALGAKHNGILAFVALAAIGLVAALRRDAARPLRHKLFVLAAMLGGAVLVLWALYGFRYYETAPGRETFNKPIAAKIADVRTPPVRRAIAFANDAHLLPRAYLWGLADVVRAGVEGRAYPFAAFGRTFIGYTPWFYFPGAVAVKVPIGLLLLSLAGMAASFQARHRDVLACAAFFAAVWLAALMLSNSGYAGVRHALAVYPMLAVFAGVALQFAWEHRPAWRVAAMASLAAAAIAAVPFLRPWEFYNAIGGGRSAYLRFGDESADLGQRTRELAEFYRTTIAPSGERAFDEYGVLDRERERRGMRQLVSWSAAVGDDERLRGWFILGAQSLGMDVPWTDRTPFLHARPVARLGNLLIDRGTFELPWVRSLHAYMGAVMLQHSPKPDPQKIETLLTEAVRLNPRAYPMRISLGNALVKRGRRDEAVRAFTAARDTLLAGDPLHEILDRHIELVRREPLQGVPQLTNPWAE